MRTVSARGLTIVSVLLGALLAPTAIAPPAAAREAWSREHKDETRVRSFHSLGGLSRIQRSFRSDIDARAELDRILAAIGLSYIADRISLRASAETANAEAGVGRASDGSEERFIFYNSTFMQRLKQQTGDHWSLVSILAHELGHHLAFHTVIPGRNHEFELEADYFSGFVLRRLGATLEQSHAALRSISPQQASETHPGLEQRLQAVSIGWTDAGATGAPRGLKASVAPPPPPGTGTGATLPRTAPATAASPPSVLVPPIPQPAPQQAVFTAFCYYATGSKAGLIEQFNFATSMVVGYPCHDGRDSAGTAITQPAPNVLAVQGLDRRLWSQTCRFTVGPKLGRLERYPQFATARVGTLCNDGQGSLGSVVPER